MNASAPNPLPDFDAEWNYNRPAETATRFNEILRTTRTTAPPHYTAELQTQIARTHSLRGEFDTAHAVLDEVQTLLAQPGMQVARVRCLLERGRTFNSAGHRRAAAERFRAAWDLSREIGQDGYAVDAAHMLAIAEPERALAWNEQASTLAESSADPRARKWRASLANNIGWTYFERKNYARAITHFERALELRRARGTESEIQIARWCVAKTLRMQGRLDEALAILRDLQSNPLEDAEPGYTFEEIAECLLARGDADAARPYFRQAYERLSRDAWLVEHERPRLDRLKTLGE